MSAPKLPIGTRFRRGLKAREALAQPTAPLHRHVRAAVALVGTNYRVDQGIQMAKNMLAIPNNRNANLKNLSAALKNALKLNDPLKASPAIKNKALWTAANYAAMKLGYKNRGNTESIHALIQKVITIKQNMNAATNNVTRQRVGNELGTTLGRLIISYSKLGGGAGNGRGANVTKGFLSGILSEIIGPRMAAAVMKTIDWVLVTRSVYKNPGLSYWNKYKKIVEPNRFDRQVGR